MNQKLVTTIGLATAVLLGAAGAEAQPAGPKSAGDEVARRIYLEGEAHYAAGRYRDAAISFESAYRLSKRPALLFNLGNAYERLGNLEKAATYLKLYLQNPAAKGADLVRQRVAALEAEQTRREEEKKNAAAAAARPAIASPPQTDSGPSYLPAYVSLGIGAAGLVSALTFGILSRNAGSDAEAQCSNDGFCPRTANDDLDREKTFALAADISLGIGIAAAGVGAFFIIKNALSDTKERDQAKQAVRWLASPVPGGAEVGLVGSF